MSAIEEIDIMKAVPHGEKTSFFKRQALKILVLGALSPETITGQRGSKEKTRLNDWSRLKPEVVACFSLWQLG